MKSEFLKLNLKDLGKGLLVAVLTAVITYLYEVIQTGDFTAINLKQLLLIAAGAGIAYLFKNFITNSDGEVAKKERKNL